MTEIDGSAHHGFKGRGDYLHAARVHRRRLQRTDDLKLCRRRDHQAYVRLLIDYLIQHGRPVVLYSDRHSIVSINLLEHEGEMTQFNRALKTLDIKPISAP
ncbi:hypothetical protein GCM10011348_03220 [Marinobacterium nitratireducens]|uniref:Uncharacterized protein n=1 Tax=Marinobacterium nitratireducens TaxID=518897 RepID=A0A917Z6T8_9GAMM|nr:hypothetical protein [Marinobacterium nitratireducens]GGO76314.1 hypothetical protein GCM10011348_03220 [Marinobacterium nitratireducens]